jgi:peptidyl-prolyl cis-trans isomerase D
MFDFVRRHTRIMQFLLFLLIFPSFVLFGIQGYNRFREKGEPVASVNGVEITQSEWDNAHRVQIERMRNSMPNIDVKLLDSPEAKYSTLERMVRDRLLQVAAEKSHLAVSDQRLANELQQNPNIASLRRPDGSLDLERYRELLAAQGMTPESFERQVRFDLATRQVMAGLGASSFAPAALADVALNAYYQQRQVQLVRFNAADFVGKVNPTQAELEAYYKAHADQFMSAEKADVEYVVLDLASVEKTVSVPEADLKTYYEQNQARLASLEERRASHILINAPASASAQDRAKAKAKAEELLAQLQKSPDKFAELARKNSQDPGSAEKGGDLDFFARGAMVKPFEDAVYALKKGETSGVVETEFGYHIIRLTDIRTPKQKSFEEAREGLQVEVRHQLAQRKFAEAAEQFTNLVYEQSDSLKPVAERLKLDIKQASQIGREPVTGNAVLSNSKLLAAIFSADSIEKKHNTEAVDVGTNQMAAARITHYSPARTLPLEEVKARVHEQVVKQQAADLARKTGESKLAEFKAASQAQVGEALTLSRDQKLQVPTQVVEAALRASTKALPTWVGVDLGQAGYAVVKVEKVLSREDAAAQNRDREHNQFAQWWASAEGLAYYNLLKEKFKVEIKAPRL